MKNEEQKQIRYFKNKKLYVIVVNIKDNDVTFNIAKKEDKKLFEIIISRKFTVPINKIFESERCIVNLDDVFFDDFGDKFYFFSYSKRSLKTESFNYIYVKLSDLLNFQHTFLKETDIEIKEFIKQKIYHLQLMLRKIQSI